MNPHGLNPKESVGPMNPEATRLTPFGDGATLATLERDGFRVCVTNRGAALVSLVFPDGTDVVLGYGDGAGYRDDGYYMGPVVGRYANRIAGGRFDLNGHTWTLDPNEGANQLHGGPDGFGRRDWSLDTDATNGHPAVRLTLDSPHLDQGFPGRVSAEALYELEPGGLLRLTLTAASDRPTVVSLTSHAYLNLAGGGTVAGHEMRLYARRYTPLDGACLPTGAILPVAGSDLDYRQWRPFDPGLDNNVMVDGTPGDLRPVADLRDRASGRGLTVLATAPAAQIYGGGGLGPPFVAHGGLCVEPQACPDAPNQPAFATPLVTPETPYRAVIAFQCHSV